jgi:hypothetical protein
MHSAVSVGCTVRCAEPLVLVDVEVCAEADFHFRTF